MIIAQNDPAYKLEYAQSGAPGPEKCAETDWLDR